jgi:hypothetical protein
MSIETPDGILDVTNATLRVPQIEVQGTSVTTSLSTLSNVGVGTSTPGGRLHVYGPDAKTLLQSTSNTANVEIGGPTGAIVDLKGPFADDYDLRIQSSGDGGNFATTGNVNHIRLSSTGGYTGFGTSSPQYKIDVQGVKGVDATSNPSAHNPVFLYDDQESTTTFAGTVGGTASRDTTGKYLELNALTDNALGYIHWPIQMPNSWTTEFDHYIGGGDGGESLSFSFFNTSAPTTTGNHGGYRLAIAEFYGGSVGQNKAVLYYQGSEIAVSSIGVIPSGSWNKVVVQYDRGSISMSFNGRAVFSYEATENADSYTGRYIGFIGKTSLRDNYHRVRNLKCTSGMTWIYPVGSNASTIAYLSGNVGIGTNNPLEQLHVASNVKATHFIGDGGLLSNIATTLSAIVNQGNVTSNTVQFTNSNTSILTTGNVVVQPGAFFVGDGSKLVNIPTDFESIIINGNTTSNIVHFNAKPTAIRATGNIVATSGAHFVGDGGLLSNIATTLESIVNQGNTTSNTVQFTNVDTAFVTSSNVGIANTAPTNNLDIGSNLSVLDTGSNVLTVRGNVSANTLTLGDFQIVPSYGLNHVTAENNQTGDTLVLTNASKAIDAASNIELGGTLKFDSNVVITGGGAGTYLSTLRVANVASNIVTYDQATGEVFDSGGLISNKLAIVSEQPPSALTGATTVVDGHGRYVLTTSNLASGSNTWNAFDGSSAVAWVGDNTYDGASNVYGGSVQLASSTGVGEWLSVEFPYKTTLRHVKLTPGATTASFPGTANLYATNDGSTWTLLKEWSDVAPASTSDEQTIVVNASASYKRYAIVATKASGDAIAVSIGEWKLFTETFTVDAGVVSTTAASGLDVGYTEHPVEPMTDYHTYVEGHGTYEASASSYDASFSLYPWEVFDHSLSTRWTISTSDDNYNASTGDWDQTAIDASPNVFTSDVGGTRYHGHWLQIKLPYAITLSHSNIYPQTLARAPVDGVILGSNDGEHWYKLTEFSGKTYSASTWTRIDVNATTSYQYFRMCATKNGGDSKVELNEWRLFAEKPVTRMENVHISGELSSETLQTGYIKWPKVPLKANASEGYVASVSSNLGFGAYSLFNERLIGADTEYWSTNATYNTSTGAHDNTVSTTDAGGVVHYGEWAQIQLPREIALSFFKVYPRAYGTSAFVLDRSPNSGSVLGSDDGINWYLVNKFSGVTYTLESTKTGERVDIHSSKAYKYYRFVFTTVQAAPGGSGDRIDMMELQLFESTLGVGTSATTAKLTVDGGLGLAKGSQVFAGSDVITEFPKHDRPLTKYPEIALTSSASNAYYNGYKITYSQQNSTYPAWKAFDNDPSDIVGWYSGTVAGTVYNGTGGAYDGTTQLASGTELGEWIGLEVPSPIKLYDVRIVAQDYSTVSNTVDDFVIYAKKHSGDTWTNLGKFTGMAALQGTAAGVTVNVNSSDYYKFFALVATKRQAQAAFGVSIRVLDFYGYEEGDTSVDVVHRSIPNTPSPQQLAVYWDANDSNSYSFADSSNVYDLSGSGVTGTITGNNGFDAEYNAWVFDGGGDYISGTQGLGTGQPVHSQSVWFKRNGVTGTYQYINIIGTSSGGTQAGFVLKDNGVTLQTSSYANDIRTIDTVEGQWYHAVLVHTGGDWTSSNTLTYVNGELATVTSEQKVYTFNLTGTTVTLGTNTSGTQGFNGSIANFRLYSKALSADQVRELYDYDAERFGHRQNLVSLHKGNLGVGVAHPTSRFEVAGDETVQEYPPRAMTAAETYMEGHGVFRANWANWWSGNIPWGMYSKTVSSGNWYGPYEGNNGYSGGYVYSGTDFAASTTSGLFLDDVNGTRYYGAWTTITMPYDIILKRIHLYQAGSSDDVNTRSIPEDGVILGSHNGSDWYHVHTFTGLTYGGSVGTSSYSAAGESVAVNAIHSYKHYALVTTRTLHYAFTVIIGELYWYGTPAPSSLEDGHLTLGKTLTLPRVSGHPTGAETPRAESLVVHYDTTVDSVVSGTTVVDVSGNGINGTLTNGAAYSSTDRAFTFDGGNDSVGWVPNTAMGISGDWVHSFSGWFKFDTFTTKNHMFSIKGPNIRNQSVSFRTETTGYVVSTWYGNNITWGPLETNKWYHVCLTYPGSASVNQKLYINGELQTITDTGSYSTEALNITTITDMRVGALNSDGSNYLDGSASKIKFWNVALTAEEVAMEYALGRTGKSLNLTDTSLCLGGTVPRAQLDVRGVAKFDRIHAIQNGNDNAVSASLKVCDYDGSNGWKIYAAKTNGNLYFDGADYTAGTACIMTDDGVGTTLNFTGQHRTFIKNTPFTQATELEGLIVSADNNKYIKMSGGIEAGSNAITTNESLPLVSLSNIAADKKCFGVISGSEDPDTRQEQYGNFVSVSQKELGDTRVYINSVGEGAMWVVNTAGALESGDYITTSNVAGYGQKQESDSLKNYTVAKITMDCDFEPATQPIQRIKQSNVVETHYMGVVSVTRGVPHEFVTTTVTADDEWSNVSISPSDVTYEEWSNLEANVQNTYTLTYTQTSNVVYDVKYTKTTTANVTAEDAWDAVHIEPSTVTYAEYSNLEANVQNTYSLTYTMTTKVEATEAIYSNLSTEDKELFIPTYYHMAEQRVNAEYPGAVKHETVTDRLENALDEHGQLQWEDDPSGATEKAYKIRYLDASGQITDEANAVHTAAFVGVTYHCG